jgi:hypothetical protein
MPAAPNPFTSEKLFKESLCLGEGGMEPAAKRKSLRPCIQTEGQMSSWRERLCGSVVLKSTGEAEGASLSRFTKPTDNISCGGGFFPAKSNLANQKTIKGNIVLPTQEYSILVLNNDGSAVIYSDAEPVKADETEMENCEPVFKS